MEYRATIEVDKATSDFIHSLENETGQYAYDKYGLKRDEIITYGTTFENGMQADVKFVISDSENTNWAEAVLFDENGNELTCTDVDDNFFGEWVLYRNDDTYTIIVKEI